MPIGTLGVLLSVAANQSARFPDLADLDRFIEAKRAEFQVPGACVAVVHDGKIVMARGFGVRNMKTGEKVDQNTVFMLASVTKSFTAVAAGTMVDKGKLGWDQPVRETLPEFEFWDAYPRENITMRDLLAHRTGWPQFTGDLLDPLGYTRAEIVKRLRYLKPAVTFRETAQYSNPGYFIAGETLARAAGSNWNAVVKNEILNPLSMSRSGTSSTDSPKDNASLGYAMTLGKIHEVDLTNQNTIGAAGSMRSCALDLAKFVSMLVNGGEAMGRRILTSETVNELFVPAMVSLPTIAEQPPISANTGFAFTMGFGAYSYGDVKVIEKGGALAGVRTVIIVVPERKAAIIVLCNLNFTVFPEAVRAYWLAKLLGRPDSANQAKLSATNAVFMKVFDPRATVANPLPSPLAAAQLVGVYENDLYGRFEVRIAGSGLEIVAGPGKLTAPLVHVTGGRYGVKWPGATSGFNDVYFEIGADGKAATMNFEDVGILKRVSP